MKRYGSAITCAKLSETPIRVDEESIVEAIPRDSAKVAKAPQSFWLKDILAAHEDAKCQGKNDYIDSCTLMMHYRPALHYIECGAENIKVTEFEDIYLMQALLRSREDKVNFSWGVI